ncbi:MAG: 50S ribosomal protein L23 [Candidatus Omnitrophica bacterium]|nr:50S ribosomal protein L23 [Candidatus Omnitrophota bacterium]
MRPPTDIVKQVLQSEKGARVLAHGQYVMDVAPDANKVEIREAVEGLFKVKVLKVNTMVTHGKWRRLQARWGRRTDRKKAIVTLAKGQKIDVKTEKA